MRRAFANRVDATEKTLVAYAKSIGFGYAKCGLDWDGDLFYGRIVIPIDWKSRTAAMTPKQQKLILAGFPLRFASTPEELDRMKAEITR